MKTAKPFLLVPLVLSLLPTALAQQRGQTSAKTKNMVRSSGNRPPIIKSLVSSSPDVTIPCPRWVAGAYAVDRLSLGITTKALDPDRDKLSYRYWVDGGRIIGRGAKVSWELTGVKPGFYGGKVQVRDGRGGSATEAVKIKVLYMGMCPLPCASVSVSCPDEVEEKQSITFAANVSGGEPTVEPTYQWTVSAGTIISGQGTPTIVVETTGLAGQQVTASLVLGGYPPECRDAESCHVRVRKQ
jgi:hypothetical protein